MPYPRTGGGGSGFSLGPINNLFGTTAGDASSNPLLITPAADRAAAETIRDNYFTANPANLAIYDEAQNASLGVLLYFLDGSVNTVQPQTRVGGEWRDNSAIIAIQGLPGSGTDFSGISDNHLPAIGSGPNKTPYDSGLFVDPETGDVVTLGSLQTGPGSIRIGPGFSVSNGVQTMALSKSTGQKALGMVVDYDETGTTEPFYYALAAQQTLDVNLLDDATLPDPYTLNYTTFGDNLTNDFIFRAATAGDVRVRYWLGNDESGMLIFDETRSVTQAEVDAGADITFGIGNPYLLKAGTQIYVRSDGIQLKGTLIDNPASPFDGQNLLYFKSLIQPFTETNLMTGAGDVPSSDVTITAADLPTIAPTATNQQLANQAIDGAVATLQNTIFNSGRSFVRFNDGFTIDNTNLATFEDKNIIYTAKNDKPLDGPTRPDVFLPTDADIAAAGESYPITFEFTHLGGTTRSTTTNVVRFFFDGAIIGQILRDDAAVIVKTGVGVDYQVSTGTFNPGDTILPTGVFNLNVDTPITNIADIATEFAGVTIVAGDAYLVETGGTCGRA